MKQNSLHRHKYCPMSKTLPIRMLERSFVRTCLGNIQKATISKTKYISSSTCCRECEVAAALTKDPKLLPSELLVPEDTNIQWMQLDEVQCIQKKLHAVINNEPIDSVTVVKRAKARKFHDLRVIQYRKNKVAAILKQKQEDADMQSNISKEHKDLIDGIIMRVRTARTILNSEEKQSLCMSIITTLATFNDNRAPELDSTAKIKADVAIDAVAVAEEMQRVVGLVTVKELHAIRKASADGKRYADIAIEYGIGKTTVGRIVRGNAPYDTVK